MIKERIDNKKPDSKNVDVLDHYTSAFLQKKKSQKYDIPFKEIIDQFFALYFAATDTTGIWNSMMCYCLAKYPEV